jgi:copper chaperone NosL
MRSVIGLALGLGWVLAATAGEYRGQPTCDYCGMLVESEAFGARLTKTTGETLIFDATECMAAFTLYKIPAPEVRTLRSVSWAHPKDLLDAKHAWYLRSDKRPSPMAMNLSAYPSRAEAERARASVGGEVLGWDDVLALVKRRWLEGKRD